LEHAGRGVDPITFEILSHRLHQIANEMGTTLERVGGTVNTTQQKDYMAALYRANGEVLSAGNTLGWHVATAGFAVKRIIERFENEGGIYPDDIFLLNDPYLAAIHQSDVYMISPIHYRERLVGWSATFVHVMDIGAMSPGGNSPGAREVCHEGLRIPGVKLVERGATRKDLFDTIINMTRQPVMVGLDLKCEIAANNVAKSRMQQMCAQYGTELVEAVSSQMIGISEATLRKRITEIPDGEWSDTGMIQSGGETWKIRLTLKKKADQLTFDFTGTDKQAKMGINLPYHGTFGACFAAVLFTLSYDVLKNHGAFRVIEVVAPEGTVVNVKYPGPVSMNTTSAGAIVKYLSSSVLMQMLATSEKWKQEVMALNSGGRTARHAGLNQYGRFYVSGLGSENSVGGTGARSYRDGIDSGGSRMTSPNVEWVERNFPLLYLHRRHVKDGGGAGKYRGGIGAESAFTLHHCPEDKIKVVAMGVAGLRNSGQGIFGGYPGAPGILVHYEDTKFGDLLADKKWVHDVAELDVQGKLLPYCEIELKKNDVLYMRTENGGGYGDPLEREAERVAKDVKEGLVSQEAAREVYGVIIDRTGDTPDLAATQRLRSKLKEERMSGEP
jgi:N-methylhydantoinase B